MEPAVRNDSYLQLFGWPDAADVIESIHDRCLPERADRRNHRY